MHSGRFIVWSSTQGRILVAERAICNGKRVALGFGKFYIGRSFLISKGSSVKIICPSCNYVGESGLISKGSRKLEITLWCCLVIPGMLYTMWRQSKDGKYAGCPKCHEANVRLMKRKEWKSFERNGQLPSE